ncbi:hypothetical protein G4G27_06820 [Sphingomonas sp. So64.6b]|uniref:hypothetical protein n=1 Tax=Sphingomonas sp. So64.6b TaxID=2997354 RepID=UPI0016024D09|nr:hypothetical protein [Sphingomonas sp. So64.6b]QNA83734.1 hypothetical protein G4G27_06820 [Sphingomonas sp. So64.6b]
MTQRIQDIAQEIVRLQGELDREIESRRRALGVTISAKIVGFERGVLDEHRRLKASVSRFFAESSFAATITAPVIYSLIIPLLFVDAWVSLYQAICFRAYGIKRVSRSEYLVFDRQHLAYLNVIEAMNCLFCAYANGLVGYVREISSRTEQYWCPIKHALRVIDPHQRYYEFLEYGDASGYRARLAEFRDGLRDRDASQTSE